MGTRISTLHGYQDQHLAPCKVQGTGTGTRIRTGTGTRISTLVTLVRTSLQRLPLKARACLQRASSKYLLHLSSMGLSLANLYRTQRTALTQGRPCERFLLKEFGRTSPSSCNLELPGLSAQSQKLSVYFSLGVLQP